MTAETPVDAPESPQEPPEVPLTPPRLTVDSEAPYGRTTAGAARAKPGRKAKSTPSTPSAPRRRSSGARTGASARKAAAEKPTYANGLKHYLRATIGGLMTFGRPSVRRQANAMTLARYGPDVCDAVGNIANDDPRLAGVLDRVMGAGPYAELAEKLSPLVLQLLVNNGLIPVEVGKTLGADDPEMLAAALRSQAAAQAARGGAGTQGA